MSGALELLGHYTTAAVAFEHVIPEHRMRLSPYRHMRDPAENKHLQPGIPMNDHLLSSEAMHEVWTQVRESRDGCRVLSMTRDLTDPEIAGDTFEACWARPRMWEQYADVHRGVCLVFNQSLLERALHDAFPDAGPLYLGAVEYTRSGIANSAAATIRDNGIYQDETRQEAVENYIGRHYADFFFLKHVDFETEHEYRAVVRGLPNEYAYFDWRDSLYAVVLGERFPAWQLPGALDTCATVGAELHQVGWDRGQPVATPVR